MTFLQAFAEALAPAVGATLDQDMFVSRVPAVPSSAWLIKAFGGVPTLHAVTGARIKDYNVQVFYRDQDTQAIYDKLYALEELLNGPGLDLEGFQVVETNCLVFPTDNDLDAEDRDVGLLQAVVSIFKE